MNNNNNNNNMFSPSSVLSKFNRQENIISGAQTVGAMSENKNNYFDKLNDFNMTSEK